MGTRTTTVTGQAPVTTTFGIPNAVTLELLVKLYYSAEVSPAVFDRMPQSQRDGVNWLVQNGLVIQQGERATIGSYPVGTYKPTAKGKFLVEHFLSIPLPKSVEAFEIPNS